MTALEMELIQVPDSIEPYIGFKYLSWHEGELWSNWGDKPWPINEPFEAECHGPREHKWETTTKTPKPRLEEIDVSGFGVSANKYKYIQGLETQEIAPPDVALPAGLSWSWEPQPPHPAVDETCHCGIYAVDTPDKCADYGPPPAKSSAGLYSFTYAPSIGPQRPGEKVLVELAMWGKVIPGTTGMRGQYAYPQRIHGSSDAAREAAKAYGVPLVEKDPEETSTKTSDFKNFQISLNNTDLSEFFGDSKTSRYRRPRAEYILWGVIAVNLSAAALNLVTPHI